MRSNQSKSKQVQRTGRRRRRFCIQLGCDIEAIEPRGGDLVPRGLERQMEANQQQPEGNRSRTLRTNAFRTFLKEVAKEHQRYHFRDLQIRSINTRRKNEEIEKAPTFRKVDSRVDRGNRGEELFRWVLGKRGFSNTAFQKVIGDWLTIWGRHRQRLGQFDEYWKSIGKSREDLLIKSDPETMISNFISQLQADQTSDANQANCRTVIAMLFRAQGVPKDKINGFALQQIMKKLQADMRQKIKEEPVWQYIDLLRYTNGKATAKQDLSENQHMGIVIALIMGYSTLRLADVHRSIVKDMKDGS
ncbi:MAG: hypothetical protein EZS28_014115 [Streblomastix strix]|uniref:Uncharacterized protein n=1 Tax=Streblomastix strix TaxID=222440 RepID=A0A5J4W6S5_9EUKA|nr:MAG: hypothetical protein EZS28_014115 [Streblomastix strix]